MELENLSKKELIDIITNIKSIVENLDPKQSKTKHNDQLKSDLESLIGSIPFLLLNKQIFAKNQDIDDFAKRLDIEVPFMAKRKREEIIGIVISAITNFDSNRLRELNMVMSTLNKSSSSKKSSKNKQETKSSFFNEWDAAIKQMRFK
jgi:hypothetical protein